jgi:hypothetical protein
MNHQPIDIPSFHPASKWTPPVRARFLEHLARKGNVRAACLLVGASTETAYRLRRRDRVFARAWDAAIALARRASESVLADRAIDGVVEDIYYRGEWIGSKRKFDARLLLAHLARLDKLVREEAEADAERFDELLAAVLGEPIPADLECADEALAVERERFAEQAARHAGNEQLGAQSAAGGDAQDGAELSSDQRRAREDARAAGIVDAEENARAEARWRWDEWHGQVCAAVDAALALEDDEDPEDAADGPGEPDGASPEPKSGASPAPDGEADISPRTVSTLSTPRTEEAADGARGDAAAP